MNSEIKNASFATYFRSDAFNISGDQLMGRQAAGNSYLKALFKEDYDNIGLYLSSVHDDPRDEQIKSGIINFLSQTVDYKDDVKVSLIPYSSPKETSVFGGIFRPDPKLDDLAKHRSYYNHDAYSLVGITHTTASHGIMSTLKDMITAPLMPWDALICTSKSVKHTVETIHNDYLEYLELRLGSSIKPNIQLPIIPLGINVDEFSQDHDHQSIYNKYNIGSDDINIIFVGRISFHAKAHNIPMFLALEKLSKRTKKNINFIMTGWFPNEVVEGWIKDEAKQLCPSVNVLYIDGRIQKNKYEVFSIGDIFFSLTDNIQETFGLTPLEAMASGIPVVVSDWDGYRDTVRDGEDGFRIKTTFFPEPLSNNLSYRFDIGADSYDRYCGYHSMFTAVDIEESIEKLELLILNEDLRKKLGHNAKKNVAENYSWSVVLQRYDELRHELNSIRLSEGKSHMQTNSRITSDRLSPFKIFNSYPTNFLSKSTKLSKLEGINNTNFSDLREYESINYASIILPNQREIDEILNLINTNDVIAVDEIIGKTSIDDIDIFSIVTLLLKYGYIKILD